EGFTVELVGQFSTTVSGRQSYEIADADWMMVLPLVRIAVEQFGFRSRLPVHGFDELYVSCVRDAAEITIGWDNWSGCFVMGCNASADAIVREMGDFVEHMMSEQSSKPES
ncbi:MAG: hypothetical protein OZ933_13425, partial [Chloroflexota bacterium]|nr:hypothetical protein [Chloroflexota bacterium]